MGYYHRPTPLEEKIATAILIDKQLTAEWYMRMSGQVPWKTGEREYYSEKFEQISAQIFSLWGAERADWFANLPDNGGLFNGR